MDRSCPLLRKITFSVGGHLETGRVTLVCTIVQPYQSGDAYTRLLIGPIPRTVPNGSLISPAVLLHADALFSIDIAPHHHHLKTNYPFP